MFSYYPLDAAEHARRTPIWEACIARRACGEAAVVLAGIPDWEECAAQVMPKEDIPLQKTPGSLPWLDGRIRGQLHYLHTIERSRCKGDTYPALEIPRNEYGQSQALAEIFGCRLTEVAAQPGLLHPEPYTQKSEVLKIKPRPLKDCLYYKSIEFARYMHQAVGGEVAIHCPVLTGPMDTANYVLGTTRLMEWVYDEPEALHALLNMITDTLIEIILLYQQAVEGHTASFLVSCVNGGYLICSEVRHMISDDTHREFELPYLKRIGAACGPYAIHTCGCFERTLRSAMEDPNLFAADFQTKETDLVAAIAETRGQLTLNVRMSGHVGEEYLWPNDEGYYRHLMTDIVEPIPLNFAVYDIETYRRVQEAFGGGVSGMFRRRI